MKEILVIGSVALDTITSPSGYSKEILGGSAVYFSISASFFAPVNLVATVGMDFPEKHKKTIKKQKTAIGGFLFHINPTESHTSLLTRCLARER